ncbi:MAG: hypothetical protein L6R41_007059 [Letrouitia leprolyta]|nr:MAG: hypothetical protein L6R41_007059 [Letrouitia leprolyta]
MPLAIYHSLLSQFLTQLVGFFERVAAPAEAPEKISFGDIDIIVSEPKNLPFSPVQIATTLNAKRTISSNPIHSFAVPYPDLEGSFVQLDIQICKAKDFEWEVFHKSHGDLWNLLGSSIRPFGLTPNDTGLHLRIPDIEASDRKKALIFLTADPNTVLDFLQLDKKLYWQGFDTVDDMFEFACSSRFFRAAVYVRDGLKANDRKRLSQRDLYRRFVDEYLPIRNTRSKDSDDNVTLTREKVADEALTKFEKADEFEGRVKVWRKEREELSHKQVTREWRKAEAMEITAYADAWIDALKSKAKTTKGI